jgi:hypothetical protein
VTTSPMKKLRGLLNATVRQESSQRRTSRQIAVSFAKRQKRAVAAATPALVIKALVKLVDEVSHLKQGAVDLRQGELFEEFRVFEVIPWPVYENGRRVRTERRALGDLTYDELTLWVARRKQQPAVRTDPLAGYVRLLDEIGPYADGETKVQAAYRAMKKAREEG